MVDLDMFATRVLSAGELTARRGQARRRARHQRLVTVTAAVLALLLAVTVANADPATPTPAAVTATPGVLAVHAAAAARPAPRPTSTPAMTTGQARAMASIPPGMLTVYRTAGTATDTPWQLLAAVGANESDHARSRAAGVHAGLNFAGCCAGPAQICTESSCGRTWQHYALDGDHDGILDVYDPDDAFATAGRYLRALRAQAASTDPAILLAAYNAGPGNVRRYRGVPPFNETRGYVAAGTRLLAALPTR